MLTTTACYNLTYKTFHFAHAQEKRKARERLFFPSDDSKRIDYVLVYQDVTEERKERHRERFKTNLDESGLDIETIDKSVSN